MGGREEGGREKEGDSVCVYGMTVPSRGSSLKFPGRGTVTGSTWNFAGRALRWTTLEKLLGSPEVLLSLYTPTAQATCPKPMEIQQWNIGPFLYSSLPGPLPLLHHQSTTSPSSLALTLSLVGSVTWTAVSTHTFVMLALKVFLQSSQFQQALYHTKGQMW